MCVAIASEKATCNSERQATLRLSEYVNSGKGAMSRDFDKISGIEFEPRSDYAASVSTLRFITRFLNR